MTSLAWKQHLPLGLLSRTRKEPWAGLLLEPELAGAEEAEVKGRLGK